jgi:hypothetical protein
MGTDQGLHCLHCLHSWLMNCQKFISNKLFQVLTLPTPTAIENNVADRLIIKNRCSRDSNMVVLSMTLCDVSKEYFLEASNCRPLRPSIELLKSHTPYICKDLAIDLQAATVEYKNKGKPKYASIHH